MVYGLYVIVGAVLGGALVWLACGVKARKDAEDLRSRLAVAEEKNVRMPKLELAIGENQKQIADLAGQITAFKDDIIQKADRIAMLNLELFERTEASKNKLTMVNDAQSRLCQALIALSETALNCDNDEFIQAMESNLSTFEESLLGDISRWQARDRAVTNEVCQMAESEQVTPALSDQDNALEELILADVATEEPTAGSAQEPDTPGSDEAEELILADVATEESTAGSGQEPDTPGSDETDTEDTDVDDLAVQRTEAELALFEKKLDEEISSEFGGTDDDEDTLEKNESPIAPPANEETNGPTKSLYFPTQGITVRYNLAPG